MNMPRWCCALLLVLPLVMAHAQTPSPAAEATGSFLRLPADDSPAPGHVELDAASKALRRQQWTLAAAAFARADRAFSADHAHLPADRLLDWGRVALLAGDLSTARAIDARLGPKPSGVSPGALAAFREDMRQVQTRGERAFEPELPPPGSFFVGHAFLLALFFASAGLGIGLAVELLRRSALRAERDIQLRSSQAFERKRLATRAAASLKP